jgi:hypothetical protein
VTSARHRQTARPRRLLRFAKPAGAATVVTACLVAVAIGRGGSVDPVQAESAVAPGVSPASPAVSPVPTVRPHTAVARVDRSARISRSAERVTLVRKPEVTGRKFMTASLNLWPAPREKGKPLAVLHEGGRVAVTGVRKAAFAQILQGGQVRWVKRAYLVDKLPKARPAEASSASSGSSGSSSSSSGSSAGISSAPCPDGSGTEAGLTSSAVRLFRSVCNAFPALSSYGGYDGHGEHSSGKAIDFMVTDSSLGQAVADWARAHASELDLYDVIWSQHIWTPARSGEGWRSMSDRGSATANHFDHVHIAVN